MASTTENMDEIKKNNEILFSDSFFRLLKFKNNDNVSEDEYRNLILQTDMHCSVLNMNKKSAEDLKSHFILQYSSIKDSEKQEGLLSIAEDDINEENFKYSTHIAYNNVLSEARECCLNFIQKGLNSFGKNSAQRSKCQNTIESLKESDVNNISNYLNPEVQQHTLLTKEHKISNQNPTFSRSTSHNFNVNSSNHKNSYSKPPVQIYPEKKRANDTSDSTFRYNKKQNRSNYRQEQSADSKTLKNSFQTASSMYKNPLRKACENKEKESDSTSFEDDSSSNIKNHPSLKNFDPKIVGIILSEIMDFSPDVKWSDIAGLEFVKATVQEIVIWPLLRPDIFTGLRAPPKGILLFGPPGTGKTLIGKCIATESNSTFFCISASSLASKWVGESEQLVRALFAIAQLHQPAVIFIDEIDSLLSQRSDQEQDHTRKLKTEFLVQFDGAKTTSERRVLVVGATNRPHELDEAARRRFVKRLYVPLPVGDARLQIIEKLLAAHQHTLSNSDLKEICVKTEGYSGSDVAHLCKEAAMGPIRSIGPEQIKTVSINQVRSIELRDFLDALKQVRASVAEEDLKYYLDWNKKFGSFAM